MLFNHTSIFLFKHLGSIGCDYSLRAHKQFVGDLWFYFSLAILEGILVHCAAMQGNEICHFVLPHLFLVIASNKAFKRLLNLFYALSSY